MPQKRLTEKTPIDTIEKEIVSAVGVVATVGNTLYKHFKKREPIRQRWDALTREMQSLRKEIRDEVKRRREAN
jgi:uncharacterized coiled-coil DUF342 family protein